MVFQAPILAKIGQIILTSRDVFEIICGFSAVVWRFRFQILDLFAQFLESGE